MLDHVLCLSSQCSFVIYTLFVRATQDVMTPDEVVDFVMACYVEGKSATAAAEALVSKVVEKGLSSDDGQQDNTSAIVVFFKPYGSGHRSALSSPGQ